MEVSPAEDGATDFEAEPSDVDTFLAVVVDEAEESVGGERFVALIGDEVDGDALEVFAEIRQ